MARIVTRMACGAMHASSSRRFCLTDLCLLPLCCLGCRGLPILLICTLLWTHNPAWALDPHGMRDPLAGTVQPSLFLSHWSRLRTVPSDRPVSAGCEERLQDGDFATDQGWILGASPRPARLAYPPWQAVAPIMHLGLHPADAAQAVASYSSIWQEIRLPADRVSTLHWSWQLRTQEEAAVNPAPNEDRQQLLLLDAEGTLLEVITTTLLRQHTWTTQTYDLSPYAGQTVRLYFNAYNDGDTRVTSIWLNEVSVQACASPPRADGTQVGDAADTPGLVWRPGLAPPPSTAGFLTWGLGLGFSLLLIVLGLWERSQAVR